jgi:hypothetical protein
MTKQYKDTTQSVESAFADELITLVAPMLDDMVEKAKPMLHALRARYAAKGMTDEDFKLIGSHVIKTCVLARDSEAAKAPAN